MEWCLWIPELFRFCIGKNLGVDSIKLKDNFINHLLIQSAIACKKIHVVLQPVTVRLIWRQQLLPKHRDCWAQLLSGPSRAFPARRAAVRFPSADPKAVAVSSCFFPICLFMELPYLLNVTLATAAPARSVFLCIRGLLHRNPTPYFPTAGRERVSGGTNRSPTLTESRA